MSLSEPFSDDLKKRFRKTLKALVSIGAERALVMVNRDPILEVVEAHGVAPEAVFAGGPVSTAIFEKVRREGTPLLLGDAREDPELGGRSSLMLSDIKAVICVPFWNAEQKVAGLLYADNRLKRGAFTRKHLSYVLSRAQELEAAMGVSQRPERNASIFGKEENLMVRPGDRQPPPTPAAPQQRTPFNPRSKLGNRRTTASIPRPTRAHLVEEVTSRPPAQARVVFFRSMATMITAGISLNSALALLGEQMEDPTMAAASRAVCSGIESGHSLSQSMRRHPRVFSDFQARMIYTGERSGKLETVLASLADEEESRLAAMMKIKNALTYPAIVISLCTVMLVLAPPYLLEGHFQLIRESGIEPPTLTRMLMLMSALVRSPAFILSGLLGLAALAWGAEAALRKREVRLRLTRFALGVPVMGRILRLLSCGRFAKVVALQLGAGLLLTEALSRAAASSLNPVLEQNMDASVAALKEGETLVNCLRQADFFPRMFIELAGVGEESGKMQPMLEWVGEMYERELEAALESMAAMIEPMVMLVMGVIVGVMLVGTMLPMVKALEAL